MIIAVPVRHVDRGETAMKVAKGVISVAAAAAVLAPLPAATAYAANATGNRISFTVHAVRSHVKFVKDTAPKGEINAGDIQRFTEKLSANGEPQGTDAITIKYAAKTMTVNGVWKMKVLEYKGHATLPWPNTSKVWTLQVVGAAMAFGTHGTVTIKPAAHGFNETFNTNRP